MSTSAMTPEQIEAWKGNRTEYWRKTWIDFINLMADKHGADYLNGLAVSICGGEIAIAMYEGEDTCINKDESIKRDLFNEKELKVIDAFQEAFDKDMVLGDLEEEDEEDEEED